MGFNIMFFLHVITHLQYLGPAPLAEDFFWPIWLDDFSTWKCAFTVDLPYVPIFSHNFSIYIYIYSIYIYIDMHTQIYGPAFQPPLTPSPPVVWGGCGTVWMVGMVCKSVGYGMFDCIL